MTNKLEEYSPEETAKRRDKVLKRMLNTPPKPHVAQPQKVGRNRKKADADQPDHVRGKPDPAP